jgi:hypothetical protein
MADTAQKTPSTPEIAAIFDRWFGDAEHCDLIDASLSRVGPRLGMH